MALPLRFALAYTAFLQAAASPASPDLFHKPLALSVSNRKVVAQTKHATVADSTSSSFRIKGGLEDGGVAELLVIPKDAKGEDVLMKVVCVVEHHGPREEDMWIRRVQVSGQWLKQKWAFKTGSGFYGAPENYLARLGDGEWQAPVELLKASDGLMSLAIHNKEVPTHTFQSSTVQDISLVTGPVTTSVVYKTSNKDGNNFNHLDIHVKGLSSVLQPMGGLLIGEPDLPEKHEDPEDPENTEDPEDPENTEDPEDPEGENTDTVTPPATLLQGVGGAVSVDYNL